MNVALRRNIAPKGGRSYPVCFIAGSIMRTKLSRQKLSGPSDVLSLSVFTADQGLRMPVQVIGEYTNRNRRSGQFLDQPVYRDGIHG